MRREAFMGSDLADVTLTAKERAALLAAAKILGQIRELRDNDDDALGVDIALAYYVLTDLICEGIPV